MFGDDMIFCERQQVLVRSYESITKNFSLSTLAFRHFLIFA